MPETLTNDGLQVVVENTSDKKVTYTYDSLSSSALYTSVITELEFKINSYGSYSSNPYGNGVRTYGALGYRNGNTVKCGEFVLNSSGISYLKTETTNWTLLESTAFAVDTWYKVRVEQTTTQTSIYVNGEYRGTVSASDAKEAVTKPQFFVVRGADVLVKSYKVRAVA